MAIVISQLFVKSLRAGIVERHTQCAQSLMYLAESDGSRF